jgi:hypothetical protein
MKPIFASGDTLPINLEEVRFDTTCPDHVLHVTYNVDIGGKTFLQGCDVEVGADDVVSAYLIPDLQAFVVSDHRLEHAICLMAINMAGHTNKEVNS